MNDRFQAEIARLQLKLEKGRKRMLGSLARVKSPLAQSVPRERVRDPRKTGRRFRCHGHGQEARQQGDGLAS